MITKYYDDESLKDKNYVILESDAEEPYSYIVSTHTEYDKAKKRLEYLRKEAKRYFDKGISTLDYILINADDERVRKCFNYGKEDE